MVRSNRDLLLAGLILVLCAAPLAAQNPQIPPAPVPLQPAPQGQIPPPPPFEPEGSAQPAPTPVPPPGAWQPAQPLPVPTVPPFQEASPGPSPSPSPSPAYGESGFYGILEISLVFPTLTGSLSGNTIVGGVTREVTVSSAELSFAGVPFFELGYRLPGGIGAVSGDYRAIVTTGSANIAGFDVKGMGFLQTRLNLNQIDIDYNTPAWPIFPLWQLAGNAGIRIATCYFDNQITGDFAQEHATSNFVGAGPQGMIEVGRSLPLVPGLSATAKLDGSIIFGSISHSFEETLNLPGGPVGGTVRYNSGQTVETLKFDIGLAYSPPGSERWARFGFGYQFEYWWNIGTSGASRGDLYTNGIYFRGEFNF
jgi:hypothetical protein